MKHVGAAKAAGGKPIALSGSKPGCIVRYFTESRTAALAVASAQVLSALSLLFFVAPVATLVRRVAGERGGRPWCSVGLSLTAGPPRIGDATWRRRAGVWAPGHEDLYPGSNFWLMPFHPASQYHPHRNPSNGENDGRSQ
jgi:hypothetical protein